MLRIFPILLLATVLGCASSKQFSDQETIEEKQDANGRVVLKKYRQLISHPAHNKLATITQVYDTLGRVIKEYGFNNPYHQSTKYLIEIVYQGTKVLTTNTFLWDKADTSDNFKNYNERFFKQTIYPDSLRQNKVINISMVSKINDIFFGYFSETFPNSPTSATVKSYNFQLDIKNIEFDHYGKLILDSIIIK